MRGTGSGAIVLAAGAASATIGWVDGRLARFRVRGFARAVAVRVGRGAGASTAIAPPDSRFIFIGGGSASASGAGMVASVGTEAIVAVAAGPDGGG